ncbi:aldo/keto reductase, partial [Schumannella luteola]
SLDDSLRRMGVDAVDIVYVHDPHHVEAEVHRSTWPALRDLRAAGIVSAIGFGLNDVEMARRFVDRLDVDVVMIAGRYNLLDTTGAALLDECREAGTSVVPVGVLSTGILANGDPGGRHKYKAAPSEIVEKVRGISAVCAEYE